MSDMSVDKIGEIYRCLEICKKLALEGKKEGGEIGVSLCKYLLSIEGPIYLREFNEAYAIFTRILGDYIGAYLFSLTLAKFGPSGEEFCKDRKFQGECLAEIIKDKESFFHEYQLYNSEKVAKIHEELTDRKNNFELVRAANALCNIRSIPLIPIAMVLSVNLEEYLRKKVTITMTTCKRIDLFCKTVNSFLNCCKDFNLVYEWLVVDDNSSEEDRKKMKELYPFIEFILKEECDKGHAKSMNILQERVKTGYVFHMEDDWSFFHPMDYLGVCIDCLEQDDSFGQCLVNRAYGENVGDDKIVCENKYSTTPNGNIYYVHHYDEEPKPYPSCAYWPHYSLRVSLIKTKVWKEVGPFLDHPNFERLYAYEYVKKGYKSIYLDNLYCLHIGKNTKDSKNVMNAYDLNNEQQFFYRDSLKVVVNNLERRPDRLRKFIGENEEELRPMKYKIYKSVDGRKLSPTPKLMKLFQDNDFGNRAGIIGCACTILKECYEFLTNDSDAKYLLILEDDAVLLKNFYRRLQSILKSPPEGFGVIFLGHFLYDKYKRDTDYTEMPTINLFKMSTAEMLKISKGGTFGFVLSQAGAFSILEYARQFSITNGIDHVIFKTQLMSNNDIYFTYPHLVKSECYDGTQKGISVDTDIQKCFTTLYLDDVEWAIKAIQIITAITGGSVTCCEIDEINDKLLYIENDTYYGCGAICRNMNATDIQVLEKLPPSEEAEQGQNYDKIKDILVVRYFEQFTEWLKENKMPPHYSIRDKYIFLFPPKIAEIDKIKESFTLDGSYMILSHNFYQ